jgi:hypothetical protein
MSTILNKINSKIKPSEINAYIYADIINSLYRKIYNCYGHELQNILDKNKRDKRLCEIIHTHCYNQTITTKNAVKDTVKQVLSSQQYANFGFKLIYAILDIGIEITDDPYSPNCSVELLSQELKSMNIDPKLEAIAMKVMDNIIVLMIIGIVLALIQIIQNCNKSKLLLFSNKEKSKFMHNEVRNICIKKSFLNTWRLKKLIKEKLNSEDYKAYGTQLREAIMDTGVELAEDETYTLVEAANV